MTVAINDQVLSYQERRAELIRKIESNEIVYSFSSFSKFMDSPRHFLEYKLDKRKSTPAMEFGTLVHCLVLEPDEFEERYEIKDIAEPSTELSKSFCDNIIQGIDAQTAFEMAGYKKGNPHEIQAKYQEYINLSLGIGDLKPISESLYKQAELVKNAINFNGASNHILNQITETEKSVKWQMHDLNWHGFIDGKGERIKADLKIVADANPRKLRYKIRDMKYDIQAALYNLALNPNDDYYIIAADRNGHVSVINVTKQSLGNAYELIEESILKLKQCIFLNKWDASYDYFGNRSGVYEI